MYIIKSFPSGKAGIKTSVIEKRTIFPQYMDIYYIKMYDSIPN